MGLQYDSGDDALGDYLNFVDREEEIRGSRLPNRGGVQTPRRPTCYPMKRKPIQVKAKVLEKCVVESVYHWPGEEVIVGLEKDELLHPWLEFIEQMEPEEAEEEEAEGKPDASHSGKSLLSGSEGG
jgi:hypothetical protein